MSSEKQEVYEHKGVPVDLEHKGSDASSSLNGNSQADYADEKLRVLGQVNPHYDHDLTWTEAEEKEVVRIFDLKILSWIGVMFFFLQLDRGNMSNALTDNIMVDLGVDLNTMTLGTTVFILFFCFFEIPSNLVLRRAGAHRWIPFLMVLWGLATAAQLWMHNKATFLICRAFVGMFEAGYIPGIAIYLTTYYKRQEMALRMSIFWSTLAIANSCAGVLAYFILQLRGTADLAGWKWLFLIEGVATTFVGVLSFFILPEGPTATRGYLRFAGYLTERQELIAITRLIRDDPSKADPSKKIVPKADVWRAVKSPRIWPNLLIGFFGLLPSTPIGGFAPLILKMLGFNGLKANLMTIPGFLLGLAVMSLVSYSSDKFNERAFHGAAATLYYACCVAGLALLPIGTDKVNLYICLIFAMGGSTCWHPVNAAWIAGNTAPVGKRTIALAMYIISVNLTAIAGANVFRNNDAPRFISGMWVLFASLVITITLFIFQRYHLLYINRKRALATKDWTAEDWKHYDETTTDIGDDRLDFVFQV
ncbi:major facilitator superfamily domain-containing protein [Linnemannia elongata]|nr:major facilitator superfamily domain-containing protein [Linnemannia elongata]